MADTGLRNVRLVGTCTAAGGVFRHATITGECDLEGAVTCEKLKITGNAAINGDASADAIAVNGRLSVAGALAVGRWSGRGEFHIARGVRGGVMKLTGDLRIGADCEFDSMELTGAVDAKGLMNADRIRIVLFGPSEAKEIGGATIVVKRSRMKAAMGWIRSNGDARLRAGIVEGDSVELEHTEADIVRGNRVKLGPGCVVRRVEYRDRLEKHPGAIVSEEAQR